MLRTFMTSAAIGALMISGAVAQANPPASQSANQPAASETAQMNGPHFLQAQTADQWAFSKFKGTNVLGPDNAKVGDVNDVIFDKQGKVHALVVGVGGFLGIGEKNVAIDLHAFQVVPYSTGMNTAPSAQNGTPSATTGTSANNNAANADNDPTRVKLKVSWTKDQLKAAPDFQYYRVAHTERPAAPSPTTGMAPAPRPIAPAAPPR
jgi:sporulation protein YlmC with PRC-barrel domain